MKAAILNARRHAFSRTSRGRQSPNAAETMAAFRAYGDVKSDDRPAPRDDDGVRLEPLRPELGFRLPF